MNTLQRIAKLGVVGAVLAGAAAVMPSAAADLSSATASVKFFQGRFPYATHLVQNVFPRNLSGTWIADWITPGGLLFGTQRIDFSDDGGYQRYYLRDNDIVATETGNCTLRTEKNIICIPEQVQAVVDFFNKSPRYFEILSEDAIRSDGGTVFSRGEPN